MLLHKFGLIQQIKDASLQTKRFFWKYVKYFLYYNVFQAENQLQCFYRLTNALLELRFQEPGKAIHDV